MRKRWAAAIRIVMETGIAVVAIACLALTALVYPGTPGSSSTMDFEGYIELPKSAALNKLDYITSIPDGLFVTDASAGGVYRVDLHGGASPKNATVGIFPGQGTAHGVVIDPVSHLAFVTRNVSNTVDVFDPNSLKLIKQIPVADDADGIFYNPASKLISVANGDPNLATIIDPAKQETIATVALAGKPEFAAYDPETGLLYQNLKDIDTIAVLDAARGAVVSRWSVPECKGPAPVVIDAPHRRLFTGCTGNSMLFVLDIDSHRVIASVPAAGQPDSIAFDPDLHRLYVTGRAGKLSVIQQVSPDVYRLLETVRMHYGAHTLALDPDTHRVYVGYASLFVSPRLAVFKPRGLPD